MITQQEIAIAGSEKRLAGTVAPTKAPCILLVEDDRSLRRYLEVVLRRAGYEVFVAADGLEAMCVVLRSAVDIVVTDAIMPNLNGYELCRFIRSTPHLARLPIVLLSALENKENGQLARPDVYLAKPVSPEELIACLESLILEPA